MFKRLLLTSLICCIAAIPVHAANVDFPQGREQLRERLHNRIVLTTTTTTEPPTTPRNNNGARPLFRQPGRERLHGSTTTTTELPTIATTTERTASIIVNNNIPSVGNGCIIHFECKKKLKVAESPKPCLKYCVKNVECPGEAKVRGKSTDCFELLENHVAKEYDAERTTGPVTVMEVAMIDFPCQPGYLPDSRGRCREVW